MRQQYTPERLWFITERRGSAPAGISLKSTGSYVTNTSKSSHG